VTDKLLYRELTQEIIGAFYTVYNEFGYGFLESVYKNALVIELQVRNLKVRREVPMELQYLGVPVGQYRVDMLVGESVVVECKSTAHLSDADNRQLLNYLRSSKLSVGLLLHFGPKPEHRRFVWTGKTFNSES
jgi:GxxExxY protein